ncbi:MAG: IS1634 family transposase, partial [Betaproteobacteria bacterium]|nr:IS1634 family transposase [Betaproteobacteria bacterium]
HAYIQLAESFRDDSGRPRQRVVSTLGRADEMGGQVDAILNALLRAKGRTAEEPQIEFESALSLGHVWALHRLWESLGFGELARIFRQARYTTAVEHAIRVMVFNRLCDPDSKLGVLRWLETVSIPQVDTASLTHQQLLRSMDALMDHHQAVDAVVAQQLRPMVDQDLSVVFYDLTSIRVEGLSELSDDVRHYGMSKEGVIARQWMLGVVQTAEGLPIYHEVFDGHQAEAPTLLPTLTKVLQRFPHIRRLIIVADRGLLSLDNIQALQAIELGGGRALEFILAVPARRYGEFVDILERFQAKVTDHEQETIDETRWQQLRLVIAHHPLRAKEQTAWRQAQINDLEDKAARWAGKLDSQDGGAKHRGRKLSDSGAKARFYHEVKEAHLAKIIKVDLQSDLFTYNIDGQALRQAELLDGKLLLVTNVTALNPQAIVQRYKSLADIERGFRVLKSEIELAPVYHRLPQRIRAHAMICFMALILYRVMRQRLKIAQSSLSPERALAQLKRIHRHRIKVNDRALHGVSTLTKDQTDLLGALTLQKPTKHEQLSLL